MIKVLVVDDSALMRKKVREMLESDPDIEVVGTARDGQDGVTKARALKPDVITMDINMPVMDGMTALCIVLEERICPVIMLSSLTQEGAVTTFEAMELGAFDYVAKPGGTVSVNIDEVRDDLLQKVKAASGTEVKKLRRRALKPQKVKLTVEQDEEPPLELDDYPAVCIGISTGGPKTIFDVLPELEKNFPAALFMVQHMPPTFTATYARRLNEYCKIHVKEAEAGEEIRPGVCYLGKGGFHMTLYRKPGGKIIIRLTKKPEHHFIPSVDVMMDSVRNCFGAKTVGVLMTGMGDDGANSMVKIRQDGGYTIAESEESCIVFGMPKEAIDRGGADVVLPSGRIAWELNRVVKKGW
ncbi:chemotaxis response regulator protein-glutamate methylesterase [Geovibrio thiophilus]|uniref:Protein-glutamate methylesterase/protein-glutamine glutaminase n=1 Tax=Geovibrio thiophilus TaxID=139438 RepID=A0A3R5Z039_9BACT|nr:chemotaxis response regulator protein-glutamate methylesterase [Geovibrio thiophilus]QAR33763.1 chemotaxis response regulator protein-glutamate methylesterase [Geovibrio thiophilus]